MFCVDVAVQLPGQHVQDYFVSVVFFSFAILVC